MYRISWPRGPVSRAACVAAYKRLTMLKNFDEVQKFGKDNMDATMKSLSAASKGFQAIAAEVSNYSKTSFESGTAAMERLLGAKTLEKAIEVQSEYVKSAYEAFVAESTKLGELYADLAKESYKPFEGYFAKVMPAK
jgi:phasin family protein